MIRIFSYKKNIFDNNNIFKNVFKSRKVVYASVEQNNLSEILMYKDWFFANRSYYTCSKDEYSKIKNLTEVKPELIRTSQSGVLYLYYSKNDSAKVQNFFKRKIKSFKKKSRRSKIMERFKDIYSWLEKILFGYPSFIRKEWNEKKHQLLPKDFQKITKNVEVRKKKFIEIHEEKQVVPNTIPNASTNNSMVIEEETNDPVLNINFEVGEAVDLSNKLIQKKKKKVITNPFYKQKELITKEKKVEKKIKNLKKKKKKKRFSTN